MRTTLSAILLSIITISAPAFAGTRKHVAENKSATVTDVKAVETKTSAPSSDTKVARPRKAKRSKTADKSAAVTTESKSVEVRPTEAKVALPEAAPAK